MKKKILVLLIIIAITLVFTYPLVLNLNSLIIDKQDGLLITWFLNWTASHPLNFNANIFYPYKLTLAYSESMFFQALLVVPIIFLFKEPLLAYNLNFLGGFILTGFSMYLLVKHLTKNNFTAFFWALIFTFGPIHLGYLAHLQLFNFWPVIFATICMFQKRWKLFILFFVIASTTTVLFFYFLLLCAIIFRVKLKYLILAVLLTTPFLIPYYLVSKQFNYVRPITDAIHNSLAPSDLWTQFFPGFTFLFLAFFTFARAVPAKLIFKSFVIVALVSFILSFGPALHIVKNTIHFGPIPVIPLPYTILYYLLPGFSGFRTPSRWILLAFFALCIMLSLASRIKRPVLYLFILIGFFGELFFTGRFPLNFQKVPSINQFPPEQIWLKNNFVGAPIIQFPIYGWWNEPGVKEETTRMYYSTIHWRPMFNGYSGFSPKIWEGKVTWLQKEFPSPQTVEYLKGLKIKLILVPKDWEVPAAKKIAEFPSIMIYEIL